MKLALLTDPTDFVQISNDMLWKDEFTWSPLTVVSEYSVTGALLVDQNVKQAGRPITLESQGDMAWLWSTRAVVKKLKGWADTPLLKFVLTLQYPTDTRSFIVMFRANEENKITASPVRGFPGFADDDYYLVTMKLMEIQ